MRTRFFIRRQSSWMQRSRSWSWNERIRAHNVWKCIDTLFINKTCSHAFRVWITMRCCNLQIYLFISHRKQYLSHTVLRWSQWWHVTQAIRAIHLPKFSIKFVSRGNERRRGAEGSGRWRGAELLWRVAIYLVGRGASGITMDRRWWSALKLLSFAHFHGHKYWSRSVGSVCTTRQPPPSSTCCICVSIAIHPSSGSSAYKISIRSCTRMNMNSYLFVHMNYTCDFVMLGPARECVCVSVWVWGCKSAYRFIGHAFYIWCKAARHQQSVHFERCTYAKMLD